MSSPLMGKPPKGYEAFSTLNPQQSQMMNMLMQLFSGQGGQMGGPMGQLQQLLSGSPEATKQFEAPLMRQFNEQTVPGLAERFSGMGAGAQRSSGFQQALGQAGAGLSEQLGSLRGGMQMQGLQGLMQMMQSMMGTQTQGLVPKQKPWWQGLLNATGEGLGKAAGAAFML